MLKKGSKLNSILTGTCPRCQEESMYVDSNPYNISKTMQMHDNCSHCHFKYKIEPNFFFGAMFVSYAVAVALGILIFTICFLVLKTNLKTAFIAILSGLILLMPVITRVSRNIYINIFVNFDKEAAKK